MTDKEFALLAEYYQHEVDHERSKWLHGLRVIDRLAKQVVAMGAEPDYDFRELFVPPEMQAAVAKTMRVKRERRSA